MNVLLIIANPPHDGHCSRIVDDVKHFLAKQNTIYKTIDLYEDKYDPVLHPDQLYTAGGYKSDSLSKKYQKLLEESTHQIYVYPIWWNTMPAILKGFFDKCFVARKAFAYKKVKWSPYAIPIKLWKGKKAAVFTTMGAPKVGALLWLKMRFKSIISSDILGFCGVKAKVHPLCACTTDPKLREAEITNAVKRGLRTLLG
ncbi:MAG: NAD(P)H dehydrogenase (quinone) [Candidatus Woesearchaeota archaeon]|jgi:NAD(P)H dehydrogenase (quinone)